jgi:drug/metabolite transporter (DMT)-like permease
VTRDRTALLAMVAATTLWGATFVVIKGSLLALDPFTLVWTRFTAATLLLGIVLLARRRPIHPLAWVGGIMSGLCGAGGFLFQAIGLTTTSAGTSAFLTCTGTLLAAVFAWPLLAQRPSARLTLGLLIAAGGSALLPARADWRLGAGEWWTLFGAAAFGLQIVVLACFAPDHDPITLTAIQAATVSIVLTPFARAGIHRVVALDLGAVGRLAYLILAGSVIAPLLQILAQRELSAGRTGLLFALELILLAVVLVECRSAPAEPATPPTTW